MDWITQLKNIKSKLTEAGCTNIVDKITNAQMSLGTPGEMYLNVMNVLLNLKESNDEEYLIIKNEIEDLVVYGKSINYL